MQQSHARKKKGLCVVPALINNSAAVPVAPPILKWLQETVCVGVCVSFFIVIQPLKVSLAAVSFSFKAMLQRLALEAANGRQW